MGGLRHLLGRRASEVAGHFEDWTQLLQAFLQYHRSLGALHRWIQHCVVSPPGAAGLAVVAGQLMETLQSFALANQLPDLCLVKVRDSMYVCRYRAMRNILSAWLQQVIDLTFGNELLLVVEC